MLAARLGLPIRHICAWPPREKTGQLAGTAFPRSNGRLNLIAERALDATRDILRGALELLGFAFGGQFLVVVALPMASLTLPATLLPAAFSLSVSSPMKMSFCYLASQGQPFR